MVGQPPTDTPFGMEPNVAAGLAYLFPLIGGIVMLAGGGTNRLVRWAAAQSITWVVVYVVAQIAVGIVSMLLHLFLAMMFVGWILWLAAFVIWIATTIAGFQGRDVRIPWIAGITESVFKGILA